jgi:Rrf2 family protein
LGISKVYLEQVFALLKRGGIVISVKGTSGGYQLAKSPKTLTAFDVLSVSELGLFEKTESTAREKSPEIDGALEECVFDVLDKNVKSLLEEITIDSLMENASRRNLGEMMYYI